MSKKILVSVIIPTYNCESEVFKCINSVINQTYNQIEIIVVDDCSSDNTAKEIDNIKKTTNIIFLKNKKNMGVSYSRNMGLQQAKGEYVMFLDGDDYLDDNTVEETLNFALENNLEIVKFNYVKEIYGLSIYNKGTFEHQRVLINKDFREIYLKMLDGYAFSSCCFQLIKLSILKNLTFEQNLTYGEDMLFSLNLYTKTNSFGYYDKPFYHYVIKSNSITRDNSIEKKVKILNDSITVYSKYYTYINLWGMPEYKPFFDKRYKKEIKSCLDQIIKNDNYKHYKEICLSINEMKELKDSNIKISCSHIGFIITKIVINFKNELKKIYAKVKGK